MVRYDPQEDHGDFLILQDPFDRDRVYLAKRYISPNGVQYATTPLPKNQLSADLIDRDTLSLELARTNRELADTSRIIRHAVENNSLVFTPDAVSFLRGLQCLLNDRRRDLVEHAQTLDGTIGQDIREMALTNR